jgi:Flp pilus assembly protein TadD
MSYSFGNLNKINAIQRGLAAARAKNQQEAAVWFEKALQENPADTQAMALLGQVLCNLGQRQQGLAHIFSAGQCLLGIASSSKDISKVLEVAAQLQQRGDFSGALELINQAVVIDETEFRGWQLLAANYAQLNRKIDALRAGEQALKLQPDNLMMQVFLASLEADIGRNEEARTRLHGALLAEPNPREAFRAHKELARVLDKLGAFDQIFPHLHAAGSLASQLPEYSSQNAALIPDMLKANIAGYDHELLGRWSDAFVHPEQTAPVFIVGFMRSGTTLMQEVLDAHPKVIVADEADFVWAMQNELHQMDRSSSSTAEKLRALDLAGIRHLREYYWQRVNGHFGDRMAGRVFVDKFTMNTIDIGLINVVFPDAKVLFVMRDPRDVCLSCFMQLLPPTPMTRHLLDWQSTIQIYVQVMDWWLHVKPLLSLRYAEFRYEDVVADFESVFRQIFEFLGVAWDPVVADFHLRAAEKAISTPSRTQVSQPLYASSVARWRRFDAEFAAVSESLQPYLQAFNYDR